jgi:hypothetical protein
MGLGYLKVEPDRCSKVGLWEVMQGPGTKNFSGKYAWFVFLSCQL